MKSKVMLMNAVAVAISLLMILGCAGHQHNDSVGDLIANAYGAEKFKRVLDQKLD